MNPPQPDDLGATVRRVTLQGFVVNLLLAVAKFVGGVLGNSQALVADAVHTVSDGATDIAILVGTRYWTAPPDRCHPHGHRRVETLITVLIAVVLGVVAVGLGVAAVEALAGPPKGPPSAVALVAALLSVVTKEWLFRYTARAGRRMGSSALVANAWHHRSDALSSLPVLVAVGLSLVEPAWARGDAIATLLVAGFIVFAAWKLARPALDQLIDAAADPAVATALHTLAASEPGVREVHALRTRVLGGGVAVDLHVLVDGDLTVTAGHAIAERVKQRLLASPHAVVDVVAHVEPFAE